MPHICLLSADRHEQEIAGAELWALSGVEGVGRAVIVPQAVDVSRAAYVTTCAELLAAGESPKAVGERMAAQGAQFERFRITLVTLPPRPEVGQRTAIVEAAAGIGGSVDLTNPLTDLLLIGSREQWYLGRVTSRSAKGFRDHEHKPFAFSSSLPARLARAMVNLVARPGDLVIDPCCGAGTLLLEAWAAGMRGVGADLNPKLAAMSRGNLLHYGRPPWVCAADAGDFAVHGDAVVTDLPYGRQSAREAGLYERLLANFPALAPRLAVVTACEISSLLTAAGYEVMRVAHVPAQTLVRRVYVAQVRNHEV